MVDPLVIRVDRPYASAEEFLEAEAWSVTARSMLLIDIGPLPEGTALRFELRLGNGRSLVVAEGFAVKHLGASQTRPAGLVVRYKRMSAASSEFVKRAVAHSTQSRPIPSPKSASVPPTTKSSSAAPQRRPTSGPPPRPSRSPAAGQSSALPTAGGRSSGPPRGISGHPGPAARSVSVVPAARRVSTIPPEPPPTRRESNRASRQVAQQSPVPSANTRHDSLAMQRLRSRASMKAISIPPDREAILSRLKKKP
jgi:hypothetical protein